MKLVLNILLGSSGLLPEKLNKRYENPHFWLPFPRIKLLFFHLLHVVLPKISENLNIPRKPLTLRTCAARCLFLYLSTNSVATGVFISARVSEFWLFSLHRFHECLPLSKWRKLRSKELALNFASSSTKLQLRPLVRPLVSTYIANTASVSPKIAGRGQICWQNTSVIQTELFNTKVKVIPLQARCGSKGG